MTAYCCYIKPYTISMGFGDSCGNEAEWEISWEEPGKAPYDTTTQACTRHVGELLTDAPVHRVYRISDN